MFEISYIFINLFSTYIVLFAYSLMLGEHTTSRPVYYLSFFGFFLITSTIYLVFDNPIYNIAGNIIALFLIAFNYRATVKKRLIITFAFFVFVVTVESVVVMVYDMLELSPHSRTNEISIIWGMALAKILTFILCGIILRRTNLKQDTRLTTKQMLSICVISIGIIVLTYVLITMSSENLALVLVSIVTLSTICIFIFNFIGITLKVQLEEQQKKQLELQADSYLNELKIVNNAQKETNYLKHDIMNHFSTMHALLNEKKYTELRTYINGITGTLNEAEKVSNTHIEELDSIINYKISTAKRCGIEVDENIKIAKEIKVSPKDYVSIIGNLFDNAIEALAGVDSDKKHISFAIGLVTSLLVIRIENPYCHQVMRSDEKFVTTKRNKKQHGLGLLQIRTLVEKYNGTMNISYDNNFIVEISMFNKS